ncbi:MAG: nucleotidyltransferase domain-containing protein [bacterium]
MSAKTIFSLFDFARTEIFRKLFLPPCKETYLREMERETNVSLGGLQAELNILTKAGFVLTRRDGNRVYFRANAEHPLFPEIQNIALKSFGLKDILHDGLKKLKGIDFAFVFGSFAKQNETPKSDVDLMVIGEISTRQLLPALQKPFQFLNREVNSHVITQKELLEKKKQKNPFILDVLKGKKIFIIGDEHEFKRLGE